MRNLVQFFERAPTIDGLIVSFAAMLVLGGCNAHARQSADATVSPDGDVMVFRGERGETMTISAESGGVWSLVLEGAGGRKVVTSSTCAPLDAAMEAFRSLPGIKPGSYAAQDAPEIRPIPPTTKDGESWSITAPGFAPDWSSVVVTITGDQGPYARWASGTLRSIQPCAVEEG